MKNFLRALRDARHYWRSLALAIVLSTGVAGLWGANIAAIFPIIQVTLEGNSLQAWNRERVDHAKSQMVVLDAKAAELQQQLDVDGARQNAQLVLAYESNRAHRLMEERVAASGEKLQPWIERLFPSTPFNTVLMLATVIVVSTLIKHVLMVSSTMLVHYVSGRVARQIRLKLFDKALSLDRGQYMALGPSGFVAHVQHTSEMLSQGIAMVYGQGVSEPLKIVACIGGAMLISWRLTLASLVAAPLVAFLIVWLNRKLKSSAKRVLNRSANLHHVMLETFNSMLTVQANSMEPFERERFGQSTRQMLRSSLKAAFYNSITGPSTELLGIAMICTALTAGSYLVISRETSILGIRLADSPLTMPTMLVFFGMLVGCSDPLRKLASVIHGVNSGVVAAESLYGLLDRPSRINEPVSPRTTARPHSKIIFRDVSFGYEGHPQLFSNVSLELPFGSRTAIVGPNGCGKSTLINLLCRFYDPTSGDILFDDVSIRDLALSDLRGRIALVSQQTELFNESALFNIRYGRPGATLEEAMEAAKKAHAHEFIAKMPDGYHTQVGPNGHRLSGGQRQRIALARALLRNAEVLILDEATSQIDIESERGIHAALRSLDRDRTVIMITHRDSTLTLADTIWHIEQGHVEPRELAEVIASRAA